MRQKSTAGGLLTFAFLLDAAPAQAHMPIGGNAFYGGITHPLSGLETILLLASVGLLLGTMPERHLFRALAGFLGGAVAGGLAGLVGTDGDALTPFLAANVAIVGALVAGNGVPERSLEGPTMPAFAGMVGLVYGASNVVPLPADWSPVVYFLGVLLVAAFCVNLVAQLAARALTGWRRIAVRVLGSWTATTGIIVAMLAALT